MTATYPSATSADHTWSRRGSTETILSIQGKETDCVCDTSDTEAFNSDALEYEPVTESEEEGSLDADTTECSDKEIIRTRVIEVSVRECDQAWADSERTESQGSDSEIDFHDYWHCAQCRATNNNPLYRYCQKCYTVRKNFFPPRPRRKHKREHGTEVPGLQPLSQDSGLGSQDHDTQGTSHSKTQNKLDKPAKKRRSNSVDRPSKRAKYEYANSGTSDSESDEVIVPLAKTISDPAISIEEVITDKVLASSVKEINKVDGKELCVICITEPKSGVFVHGRIAHICCCYKCAKKVWAKAKRCPVCNCKISNVLKAVVM